MKSPLFSLAPIACLAQDSEFQFRNDERPRFTKSVDVTQLKQLQASEEVLILDGGNKSTKSPRRL